MNLFGMFSEKKCWRKFFRKKCWKKYLNFFFLPVMCYLLFETFVICCHWVKELCFFEIWRKC